MVTKGAAFGASMKLRPNTGGRTFRGPSNPNMVWDHFLSKKSFRFAGIQTCSNVGAIKLRSALSRRKSWNYRNRFARARMQDKGLQAFWTAYMTTNRKS
jgi:hypothetical protein